MNQHVSALKRGDACLKGRSVRDLGEAPLNPSQRARVIKANNPTVAKPSKQWRHGVHHAGDARCLRLGSGHGGRGGASDGGDDGSRDGVHCSLVGQEGQMDSAAQLWFLAAERFFIRANQASDHDRGHLRSRPRVANRCETKTPCLIRSGLCHGCRPISFDSISLKSS
jgi:hypothetical protein